MVLSFDEYKTEAQKLLEFAKSIERSFKADDVEVKDIVLKSTTEKARYSGQAGVDKAQESKDNPNNIRNQRINPLENEKQLRVEAGPDSSTRQENKSENPLIPCADFKVTERKSQSSVSNFYSSSNGNGRTDDSYDPMASTSTSTAVTYKKTAKADVEDQHISSSDSQSELNHQTNVNHSIPGNTDHAVALKMTSIPWNGMRDTHANFYPSGTPPLREEAAHILPQEGFGSNGRMPLDRKFNRGHMHEKNLVESAQRSTSLVKTLLGEDPSPPSMIRNSIPYSGAYSSDARNPPPSYQTSSRYQEEELLQPETHRMPQDSNPQGYLKMPDNYGNHMLLPSGYSSSYPPINYPLSSNGRSYIPPTIIGNTQYNGRFQTDASITPQQSSANFPSKQGTALPVPTVQNRNLPDLQPYNQNSSNDKSRSKRWKKENTWQEMNKSQNLASKVAATSKVTKKKPKTLKRMDGIAKKYNLEP